MKFHCVGFDIRVWPWNNGFYVDDTGWDLDDDACELIKSRFGLQENTWQLLEIPSQVQFRRVCEFVATLDDVNMNSIEVPLDIVQAHDAKWGADSSNIDIDLSPLILRGLDICDYDGWFSAIHHPEIFAQVGGLLDSGAILAASRLAAFADKICPEHSPHTVARIRTVK